MIALATSACALGGPSVLDAHGASEKRVEGLWWLLFAISAVVLAVVLGLMTAAIIRRRRRGTDVDRSEPRWGEPFVVLAGVIIPVLILTAVFVVSVRDMNAIAGGDPQLTVQVIGHMWWWEARYPNGAITANEIHIPAGEPVRIEVTTADVIHSFWVPQLAPKIDMIPGKTNSIVLVADSPGRYRGQCAEFCGLQHAHMAFFVVADPPDVFQRWMAHQEAPAAAPTGSAADGLAVFLAQTCDGCHTIRGTPASAALAPDLTHLADRETIAAGTLRLTRGNLAHWIRDPQAVKPGVIMPPTQLTRSQLQSLVDYLMGLN